MAPICVQSPWSATICVTDSVFSKAIYWCNMGRNPFGPAFICMGRYGNMWSLSSCVVVMSSFTNPANLYSLSMGAMFANAASSIRKLDRLNTHRTKSPPPVNTPGPYGFANPPPSIHDTQNSFGCSALFERLVAPGYKREEEDTSIKQNFWPSASIACCICRVNGAVTLSVICTFSPMQAWCEITKRVSCVGLPTLSFL